MRERKEDREETEREETEREGGEETEREGGGEATENSDQWCWHSAQSSVHSDRESKTHNSELTDSY